MTLVVILFIFPARGKKATYTLHVREMNLRNVQSYRGTLCKKINKKKVCIFVQKQKNLKNIAFRFALQLAHIIAVTSVLSITL